MGADWTHSWAVGSLPFENPGSWLDPEQTGFGGCIVVHDLESRLFITTRTKTRQSMLRVALRTDVNPSSANRTYLLVLFIGNH